MTEAAAPSAYVRERHNDGRRDVRWPAAPEPLAVPVYDNHAHLEIADGDEPLSLDQQLERADAVGADGGHLRAAGEAVEHGALGSADPFQRLQNRIVRVAVVDLHRDPVLLGQVDVGLE